MKRPWLIVQFLIGGNAFLHLGAMLQKSEFWMSVAFLLPPLWRGLSLLPAIRARTRAWDTLIASMVDYHQTGEAHTEAHIAAIKRLEEAFEILNRRTATAWKALKIIGVSWLITLVGFFDLLSFSAGEHALTISFNVNAIKTEIFSSIWAGVFLFGAAATYFWIGGGHKPLPDIDYTKQYKDFLKRERSNRRRRERRAERRSSSSPEEASIDPNGELRDLFGLAETFSLAELKQARRRLAAYSHPDRWLHVSPEVRAERENEFKRVGAAYEQLKDFAS